MLLILLVDSAREALSKYAVVLPCLIPEGLYLFFVSSAAASGRACVPRS